MEKQHKIAVLIDGENISKKYIKLIFDELNKYGTATYKRLYGDVSNNGILAWKEVVNEYALTPIFQFNYTAGKNSSDSAMVIDAMDILYSQNVDSFCLVTSDSDFTKLAIRLREAGMLVIGMGETKTPLSLVSACEEFKYLDLLYKENINECNEEVNLNENANNQGQENGEIVSESKQMEEIPERKPILMVGPGPVVTQYRGRVVMTNAPNYIPSREEISNEIKEIIEDGSDEDEWITLAEIGNMLKKRIPGFDPRNYGYQKLRPFIDSIGEYEVKETPNSKNPSLKIVLIKLKQ